MPTNLTIYETTDGTPLRCVFNNKHSVLFQETRGGEEGEYYCQHENLGVFFNPIHQRYWCQNLTDWTSYEPKKSLTIIRES